MLKWLFSISTFLLLTSCEKKSSFTPNSTEQLVVVEATIENSQPPMVVLSKSLNFFTEITPDLLASSFIHGADITVSNGIRTHRLKEYSIPGISGYDFFYYSIDSSNLATAFTGQFGGSYSLRINTGGREYTATTSIPLLTKKIDSLWWEPAPDNDDTSKVMVMGRFSDPPGYGNYIRYFTAVNDEPFFPGLNSVFDDQIIDGKTYSVQVEKGVNRNEEFDIEEYSFFDRGDSVTVRFTNIDKPTFDFWRTMEYSYQSIGNPFSSPTKVLSNIKGGGLGYFGGYAAQFVSVKIPD